MCGEVVVFCVVKMVRSSHFFVVWKTANFWEIIFGV